MIQRNIASYETMRATLEAALAKRDIPIEDVPPILEALREKHEYVLKMMDDYVPEGAEDDPTKQIEIALYDFMDHGGNQIIADGAVSDKARPVRNEYNWHLQNTSQWLFAFGLLFDCRDRRFSVHT